MKIGIKQWFIYSIIIFVIGTLITNWLLNIKILSWIWQNILSFQVTLPLWIIILLILCLISLIIYVGRILYKKHKNKKPDWFEYKEDKIFDIYWEWIWLYDRVDNLFPRCPKCSTKLDKHNFKKRLCLTCDNCRYFKSYEFDENNLEKKVINEIDRRIKTGEYKNS